MNKKSFVIKFIISILSIYLIYLLLYIFYNPEQRFNWNISNDKYFSYNKYYSIKQLDKLSVNKYKLVFGTS